MARKIEGVPGLRRKTKTVDATGGIEKETKRFYFSVHLCAKRFAKLSSIAVKIVLSSNSKAIL